MCYQAAELESTVSDLDQPLHFEWEVIIESTRSHKNQMAQTDFKQAVIHITTNPSSKN